jgi:hypothetical protein
MPDPTEIPAPLSDRSHAHGRNVMAVAGVILVLTYVRGVDINKFSPLGFSIGEGHELSAWGLLVFVLVYYGGRFGTDCWTDYNGWRDTYKQDFTDRPNDADVTQKFRRHIRRLNRKFWFLDAAPPAVMFFAAIIAAYGKIAILWN